MDVGEYHTRSLFRDKLVLVPTCGVDDSSNDHSNDHVRLISYRIPHSKYIIIHESVKWLQGSYYILPVAMHTGAEFKLICNEN